jgi:hypothetical protein
VSGVIFREDDRKYSTGSSEHSSKRS